MRRRPFYGLAALAVGATLTLAGCSGSSDDGATGASPAASAASSAAGTTAPDDGAATETAALTADDFAQRIAAAQKEQKSVRLAMTTTVAGQKVSMEGKVDLGGSTPAMDETMTVPGMSTIKVRAVDGIVYMNLGALSKDKWIKVDPQDTSNPLASQFSGMLDGADPTQQIEGLKDAIASVEKSGAPETVDGVQAQKYVVTVDTAKLGDALTSQLGASGASLPKTITYTYWVDGDDLVRKVNADVSGAEVDMTFSHWGEPVTVTAPPASDILSGGLDDLTALAS